MPAYYHNEMLFSEIYLEEITRQPENAEVLATFNVLKDYREFSDSSSLEAWKSGYVREVLSTLGFYTLANGEHTYYLFQSGSSGDDQPQSICYVVLRDESLDNTTVGRNWAEKIIRALREKNLHWGLLTNGRLWRIYHTEEPTPYETYLEMDLDSILRDRAKEPYQIFFKFMQAQNFADKGDGKCQFDRFKKESQDKIDYIEKELANALKQREEGGKGILSDLCMGYVNELRRKNEGDLDNVEMRKKIYHAAMLYMFRLLFLLYADARRLLSDDNHNLLEKVIATSHSLVTGKAPSDLRPSLWKNLEAVFVDIDQTYNGGLFSPQESEFTLFLSETPIANSYLANVVFNLTTYHEKKGEEKPISYRDMGVRHLGTLYEGLLEHKLFIAEEDTEVKVSKGRIQFIPASQGGKIVVGHYIKAGEVYFAGDPSERKSTGSYYTPEYIVGYIVRNTVGEKLIELNNTFLKDQRSNHEAYTNAVDEDERNALRNLLEEKALTFVREQVLDLSVLDPAMGSGHFLVNAANLISNFITKILNELSIEGNLESGTAYWRRWVVENCIYGVDINPLAVELAKLSLWILSMAKNQPLSFLNHHLKCGNSLIGARLDEIGNYPFSTTKKEPRQLNLFERDPDFKAAVEEVIIKSRLIAGKVSASLDDVREKKGWLEEIDQILEGYRTICDVHTSLYFNNQIDEYQYLSIVKNRNFLSARLLNIQNQYFHWELSFPQILLNQGGFNCIIGNPPYLFNRNEGIDKSEKNFYCSTYNIQSSQLFTYYLFLEQSVSILQMNGTLGLITPNNWLTNSSFSSLRKSLLEKGKKLKIANILEKVFESANVDTAILIFSKGKRGSEDISLIELRKGEEVFSKKTQLSAFTPPLFIFNIGVFKNGGQLNLIEKIESNTKPLSSFCRVSTGLKAYQTGKGIPPQSDFEKKNRIYHSKQKNDNTYGKYLEGRDVRRYQLLWSGQYLSYGQWLAEPRRSVPFDNERILVRQIPSTPPYMILGTLVSKKYYNDINSMVVFSPEIGITLKFILGIINSRLISFWFQKKFDKLQRSIFPQFRVNELSSFPIMFDSNNKSHKQIRILIERFVGDILELLRVEIIDVNENRSSMQEVEKINNEIDYLVYQLYGINPNEIMEIERDS